MVQPELSDFDKAVEMVRSKAVSLREAARVCKVPRSTLSEHVSGKRKKHTPGPDTKLTAADETNLVIRIDEEIKAGRPPTLKMLREWGYEMAFPSVMTRTGETRMLSYNWAKGFLGRAAKYKVGQGRLTKLIKTAHPETIRRFISSIQEYVTC